METSNSIQLFPETLETDLILPPCLSADKTRCVRSIEEEKVVLEIYLGYTIAMKNKERIEDLMNYDKAVIALNTESLSLCEDLTDRLEEHSDNLTKIWEKEHEARVKAEKKKGPNPWLVGLSSAAGGVVVGFIVGMLVSIL